MVQVGDKYNHLTVLERVENHITKGGSTFSQWLCKCDCGNHTVSYGRHLRLGKSTSCGCMRIKAQAEAKFTPKAELWTMEYFDNKNIKYEYQKSFPDLIGFNGGLLSYDFFLIDKNALLELNGLQHYKSVEWFGGENTLKKQQYHDTLKKQYAMDHGFDFIEIFTDHIKKNKLISLLQNYNL